MEKQAEGASWTTPVLLWITHISGLLLSFRVYLSPLVSCTWEGTQNPVRGLAFWPKDNSSHHRAKIWSNQRRTQFSVPSEGAAGPASPPQHPSHRGCPG